MHNPGRSNPDVCGLDVSAKELVVMIRRDGKNQACRSFPNTCAGHQELLRYLTSGGEPVRVCMESTGLYGLDAALALQGDSRIEIMVANPRGVRDFARALLQRSKTDPLDAWVLLEYAARMPFQPWQPPAAEALHITALARRIHALTQQCTGRRIACMRRRRRRRLCPCCAGSAGQRAQPGNCDRQVEPGGA